MKKLIRRLLYFGMVGFALSAASCFLSFDDYMKIKSEVEKRFCEGAQNAQSILCYRLVY